MERGRQARILLATGAAAAVAAMGACSGGDDLDLPEDQEIETPGPGSDEGEGPNVDVESGIEGVDG